MKNKTSQTLKISSSELSNLVELKLDELSKRLPDRIAFVLREFIEQDLNEIGEIDLFEVLVKLLLKADEDPASLITDLMGVLHKDDCSQLEDWTISKCSGFIRDFLKKDDVLFIFDKTNNKSRKSQEIE